MKRQIRVDIKCGDHSCGYGTLPENVCPHFSWRWFGLNCMCQLFDTGVKYTGDYPYQPMKLERLPQCREAEILT